MADKPVPTGGGGGGVLKKSPSAGLLKRSSSVEILTGINHTKAGQPKPANAPTNANGNLAGLKTSQDALTSDQNIQKSTNQPPSREKRPKLPSSASTPAFNTGLSMLKHSNGSLSSIKSHSPPSGSLSMLSDEDQGSVKTSTPVRPLLPKSISVDLPSPVGQPKTSYVKPAEGGHLFKVTTTEPPADIKPPVLGPVQKNEDIPAADNPLVKRRNKKISVASVGAESSDGTPSEPVWQKRLSQLFVPPSQRELSREESEEKEEPKTPEIEEYSKLLPKSTPKLQRKKTSLEDQQNVAYLNELNKGLGASSNKRKHSKEETSKRKQSKEETVKRKQSKEEKEEEEEEEGGVKFNNRINFHEDVVLRNKRRERGRKKRVGYDEDEDRLSVLDQIERISDDDDDSSKRGVIGPNRLEDTKSKASRASSQNSLSSLIRERMGRPQLPTTKKTRADLGLMILVGVLFVIIVVGISLTSYFYNLHLLEMTIFNSIKFFEKSRILEIFNPHWESVATAHLGSNLPHESIPEDCTHYLKYLHKHNLTMPNDEYDHGNYQAFVCLDWNSLARLQLRKMHPVGDVQCYAVWWVAAREDFTLRDCLQVGEDYGAWWGGGEMSGGGYPVTTTNIAPTHMVTGKLGTNSWGQLLRRTWLSERASLLMLPDSFQGYVSVNHENDNQVCIESRPHPHLKYPTPTLEYTLCTAPDITILSQFLHEKAINSRKIVVEYSKEHMNHTMPDKSHSDSNDSVTDMIESNSSQKFLENFSEEIITRVKDRIDHPVWIPWIREDLTQDAVLKYAESIVSEDYGSWGHILLPPTWQTRPGELSFDSKRFPDPAALVNSLETKGFRLALSIHPFVSVNAPAFNSGTQEGLWVRQSESPLPALAQYNDTHPSVVTDFSNPKAKEWFSSRLKILKDSFKIDRFHLQPADAHTLPAFHEYHMPLPGPDSVLVHFMASVSTISPPMSSEGAVSPPLPPTFLTLGHGEEPWEGLETLIPRVLTLTMLGYPLIDIGIIGGKASSHRVPESELYYRWIEVAAFLPAFQINVLPRMYGEEMKKLAIEYNKLRKELVLPRLHQKIPDALERGTPLIMPLALFDPTDPVANEIGDQWILGNDLLVAPVTQRGERSRDIYLPEGIWEDGIDHHLRRGPMWITKYKVPLTKIPYFILKPIDDFST